MGRMPHVAWDASGWTLNWPVILLIGVVGLILVIALIAALTHKKQGDIWPRVPFVDVFEEEQETTIVVELPGVSTEEIRVEVNDDMVTVETTGERKYAKDIVLEEAVDGATIHKEYRDGLLTLRFARPAATAQPGTVGSAAPATA